MRSKVIAVILNAAHLAHVILNAATRSEESQSHARNRDSSLHSVSLRMTGSADWEVEA